MSARNAKVLGLGLVSLALFGVLTFCYVYAFGPGSWLEGIYCGEASSIGSWLLIVVLLVLAAAATIRKPLMLIPLYLLVFLFVHAPDQDWLRFLDPVRCAGTDELMIQIFLVNIPLVIILQTAKKLKEVS